MTGHAAGVLLLKVSAAQQSPYEVLGVQSDASLSDIKKAFRKRALKVHPDVNKQVQFVSPTDSMPAPGSTLAAKLPAVQANAAAEFQACKEAYKTLSDTAKRKAFDQRQRSRQQSPGVSCPMCF